jgi:hypothetical protein
LRYRVLYWLPHFDEDVELRSTGTAEGGWFK